MNNTRIYYKVTEENEICLVRVFGEDPRAVIPPVIDGRKVTGIAPYCFARSRHYEPEKCRVFTAINGESIELAEQAGTYVTSITLPDTVKKIGSYAFYGCRNLEKLSLPARAQLETDVFMNCTRLGFLRIAARMTDETFLKQYLAQISWNVEVCFEDAAVFFPEYSEMYEDLGPAHVFELHVTGEGFRARRCFDGNILNTAEYDAVFPKACAEEPMGNLCRTALLRLTGPVGLSEERRLMYGCFLKEKQKDAAAIFLREAAADPSSGQSSSFETLEFLFREKWFGQEALDALLQKAAEEQNAELTANLIKWKRLYIAVPKKSRYQFDAF